MVESTSRFRTYAPRVSELRGVIAYYYIHFASTNIREEFTYYPHYRNALTSYLGSKVVVTNNTSTVKPDDNSGLTLLYTRNYSESIQVRLQGPFTKLGIAFEPLGLQRFLKRNYREVASEMVIQFNEFGPDFENLCEEVLKAPSEDPTAKLDDFFCSKMGTGVDPLVKNAVEMLLNKEELQLEDLAINLGMSIRTLQRRFIEHLACSPRAYQQVIRFRKAINAYQNASAPTTFTQLAMEANYYDQPAFVNHFKRITGKSPRAFFGQLQKLGSEDTYWAFK